MKHKILKRGDGYYTVRSKHRFWPFGWLTIIDRVSTLTLAKQYAKDYEKENRKSVEVSSYDNESGWSDETKRISNGNNS